MVKDVADLRARRVLTPEGLKREETADPSSSVTPTGPQPQECERTEREGEGSRKYFCLPTALQNECLLFLGLCGLLFDERKLYIKT